MIHIFGGGTVFHVANHFGFTASAKGTTARAAAKYLEQRGVPTTMHLTAQASHTSKMETNEDVEKVLRNVLADPATSAIVFNVAMCDFEVVSDAPVGKRAPRLASRDGELLLKLTPSKKVLPIIKQLRPDVVVVGFKATANASRELQCALAERQIRETGVDYVIANDTVTQSNIFVKKTASGVECSEANDRDSALSAMYRSLEAAEASRG